MDEFLIKKTIQEWQLVQKRIRDSSALRAVSIKPPTKKLARAIIGVRRSGKTTSAIQMFEEMNLDEVLYYNFEDPLFYPNASVHDIDQLISVAEQYSKVAIKILIFDEIQNIDGWERWLRKAIDMQEYKIVITGSSAKLLSKELATSVAGRALEHVVWPLSFAEFISFQNRKIDKEVHYLQALRDYLKWGGFPEVVLSQEGQKAEILKQYLSDIVYKDVVSRNEIRNKRALDQIIAFYFTNLSSLHSSSSLKKAFSIGLETAASYTEALSEAFLVFEVERYHNNLKVQVRDPKKLYVIDTGLRQVAARSREEDLGKLLENAVFLELKRLGKKVMYFKKTQEVDFVIVEGYKAVEAIQVCASDLRDPATNQRETAALLECMTELDLKKGQIITWDREQVIKIDKKIIEYLPAYKWFLQ